MVIVIIAMARVTMVKAKEEEGNLLRIVDKNAEIIEKT